MEHPLLELSTRVRSDTDGRGRTKVLREFDSVVDWFERHHIEEWRSGYCGLREAREPIAALSRNSADVRSERAFWRVVENGLSRFKVYGNSLRLELREKLTKLSAAKGTSGNMGLLHQTMALSEDISRLSHFMHTNCSCVQDVLRLYQDITQRPVKEWVDVGLGDDPCWDEELRSMLDDVCDIYVACDLWDQSKLERAKVDKTDFVRKTTKYIVPKAHVVELENTILRALPISYYDKRSRRFGTLTTSVYLDNPQMEFYHTRLNRHHLAKAIRFRQYGHSPRRGEGDVWLEVKTHIEGEGMNSLKKRTKIPKSEADQVLYPGQLTTFRSPPRGGGAGGGEALRKEVEGLVRDHGLRPVLTTKYNRTVFQMGGNDKVRLCVDTKLEFRGELEIPEGHWAFREHLERRQSSGDVISHFPHAILEVKIDPEEPCPEWLEQLTSLPYLQPLPKFSKFCHGLADIYTQLVPEHPYWLPDVAAIAHPWMLQDSNSNTLLSAMRSGLSSLDSTSLGQGQPHGQQSSQRKQQVVSDGASGCCWPLRHAKRTKTSVKTNAPPKKTLDSPPAATTLIQEGKTPSPLLVGSPAGALGVTPVVPLARRGRLGEPKAYMANERTFLQWTNSAVTVAVFALALNQIGGTNSSAKLVGKAFLPVACIIILYALVKFHLRARTITARERESFHDPVGPTILVFVMISVLVFAFLFETGIVTELPF